MATRTPHDQAEEGRLILVADGDEGAIQARIVLERVVIFVCRGFTVVFLRGQRFLLFGPEQPQRAEAFERASHAETETFIDERKQKTSDLATVGGEVLTVADHPTFAPVNQQDALGG